MLGYLYRKRFGSKIAWANGKEGDRVGAGLSRETFSNLVILHTYPPIKMEQTECSETLAYKIKMPGNYPEESLQGIILSGRNILINGNM